MDKGKRTLCRVRVGSGAGGDEPTDDGDGAHLSSDVQRWGVYGSSRDEWYFTSADHGFHGAARRGVILEDAPAEHGEPERAASGDQIEDARALSRGAGETLGDVLSDAIKAAVRGDGGAKVTVQRLRGLKRGLWIPRRRLTRGW